MVTALVLLLSGAQAIAVSTCVPTPEILIEAVDFRVQASCTEAGDQQVYSISLYNLAKEGGFTIANFHLSFLGGVIDVGTPEGWRVRRQRDSDRTILSWEATKRKAELNP